MYIYLYKSIYERQTDGQEARLVEGRAGVPLLLSFCALVSLRTPPTSSCSSPVAPPPNSGRRPGNTLLYHDPLSVLSWPGWTRPFPLTMPKTSTSWEGIWITDFDKTKVWSYDVCKSFLWFIFSWESQFMWQLASICMLYSAAFSIFRVSLMSTSWFWSFVNLKSDQFPLYFIFSQLNI